MTWLPRLICAWCTRRGSVVDCPDCQRKPTVVREKEFAQYAAGGDRHPHDLHAGACVRFECARQLAGRDGRPANYGYLREICLTHPVAGRDGELADEVRYLGPIIIPLAVTSAYKDECAALEHVLRYAIRGECNVELGCCSGWLSYMLGADVGRETWDKVVLHFHDNVMRALTICFASDEHIAIKQLFQWPITLHQIRHEYALRFGPLVEVVIGVAHAQLPAMLAKTMECFGWHSVWDVGDESTSFRMVGPYADAEALIATVKAFVWPHPDAIAVSGPDRQRGWHASRRLWIVHDDLILVRHRTYATWIYANGVEPIDSRVIYVCEPLVVSRRWPYNCCALVDMALTLALPPYVLLEIADWLPEMWRFPRARKVETLSAVCKSVAACRSARANRAVRADR